MLPLNGAQISILKNFMDRGSANTIAGAAAYLDHSVPACDLMKICPKKIAALLRKPINGAQKMGIWACSPFFFDKHQVESHINGDLNSAKIDLNNHIETYSQPGNNSGHKKKVLIAFLNWAQDLKSFYEKELDKQELDKQELNFAKSKTDCLPDLVHFKKVMKLLGDIEELKSSLNIVRKADKNYFTQKSLHKLLWGDGREKNYIILIVSQAQLDNQFKLEKRARPEMEKSDYFSGLGEMCNLIIKVQSSSEAENFLNNYSGLEKITIICDIASKELRTQL